MTEETQDMEVTNATEAVAEAEAPAEKQYTKEEVDYIVDNAIKASAAAAAATAGGANAGRAAAAQAVLATKQMDHGPVCGDCGQFRKACKGEHERMYVGLTRPELHEKFMWAGIQINMMRYVSNHPSHLVTVPRESVGTIRRQLQEAEKNYIRETTKINHTTRNWEGVGAATANSARGGVDIGSSLEKTGYL